MCNHEKLVSVNCVIKCAVCGAVIQPGAMQTQEPKNEATSSVSAGGADTFPQGEGNEKPTRGRKKKGE